MAARWISFPHYIGTANSAAAEAATGTTSASQSPAINTEALIMGYYDGNTVTALLELRPAITL